MPALQSLENLVDVGVIAKYHLNLLAETRNLDPTSLGVTGVASKKEWPSERLVEAFVKESGGLVGWISLVIEYLIKRSVDPLRQLERLVSPSLSPSKANKKVPALKKMEALYAALLAECPWDDEDFVEGYQSVLGALLCLKEPLSATSLDTLLNARQSSRNHGEEDEDFERLGCVPAVEALAPIAPLLTGILDQPSNSLTPLQIIHSSFKNFVTHRASSIPESSIDQQKSEERLAMDTLAFLNTCLPTLFSTTGSNSLSLKVQEEVIEESDPDQTLVFETEPASMTASNATMSTLANSQPQRREHEMDRDVLEYARKYWLLHVVAVSDPSEQLLAILGDFLNRNVSLWMRACVNEGEFRGLGELVIWSKVRVSFFSGILRCPLLIECLVE